MRTTVSSFFKSIGLILGLFLIVLGTVYVFGIYNNHSSAVGFQQYEPKRLPGGLNVQKRVIEIWANHTNPLAPNKILRIHSSDKNFSVGEEAFNGHVYNCNQVADNAKCSINETLQGQKYELITTTQYLSPANTPTGQDVYLRKGNTHIWVNVSGNPSETYTKEEWDVMIDSLVPIHYKDLPTEYYVPGS